MEATTKNGVDEGTKDIQSGVRVGIKDIQKGARDVGDAIDEDVKKVQRKVREA